MPRRLRRMRFHLSSVIPRSFRIGNVLGYETRNSTESVRRRLILRRETTGRFRLEIGS
jgi:hypothetical protein